MKKNTDVYLRHILDAMNTVSKYTHDTNKETFLSNTILCDAVIRQIEIIGEASAQLDVKFRSEHSDIPWSAMIGMRNMLIHQYFGVDLEIVWETATGIIPKIQEHIENLL